MFAYLYNHIRYIFFIFFSIYRIEERETNIFFHFSIKIEEVKLKSPMKVNESPELLPWYFPPLLFLIAHMMSNIVSRRAVRTHKSMISQAGIPAPASSAMHNDKVIIMMKMISGVIQYLRCLTFELMNVSVSVSFAVNR